MWMNNTLFIDSFIKRLTLGLDNSFRTTVRLVNFSHEFYLFKVVLHCGAVRSTCLLDLKWHCCLKFTKPECCKEFM